jgi:hypothetical protein
MMQRPLITGAKMKALATLSVVLILGLSISASAWERTYGGTNTDRAFCVARGSDGGSFVAGGTRSFGAGGEDIWVLRLDSLGDTLWSQTFGGTSTDQATGIVATDDGGCLVAGHTDSYGAGNQDAWLIKLDAFGDTLWTRIYGDRVSDGLYGVTRTPDGGYLAVGWTRSFGALGSDGWLIKLDAGGDTLWTRRVGRAGIEQFSGVVCTPDGGYLAAGLTNSYGAGSDDAWVVKLNSDGDTLWTHTYGASGGEYANSIAATPEGGFILAATTDSYGLAGEAWILKCNGAGDTLWTRLLGGANVDEALSVVSTADSGALVAGYTASFGAGYYDAWLIRLDVNGDTIGTYTFGGTGEERASGIALTSTGGCILVGHTTSYGAGNQDFYIVEVDSLAEPPQHEGIALSAGWNLTALSCGTLRSPISAVQTDPPGSILTTFYIWNGSGYAAADSLSAGRPFWVLATRECNLFVE